MSSTILWNIFSDAVVDSFNIYRSITGITVTFPNSLAAGDTLVFAATSPKKQTVTLSVGVPTIDTVLADINAQAHGLKAVKSTSGTTLYIRCTSNTNPKLKLYPCTFLTHTGQTVRIIAPKSEWSLLTSLGTILNQTAYDYPDPNGDSTDWYRITTVTGIIESLPSQDQKASVVPGVPGSFCVVEGRVIDLQNRPVASAHVRATIMIPVGVNSNSGVTKRRKVVITDSFGRWSMPILQKQQVLFEIPAIGYNQVIKVPEENFALFKDLAANNDYYFNPAGESVP